MKSTDQFKETIKSYLDDKAKNDSLFNETYKKENKNIDECIQFILHQVQASGKNGFTDNEIYSLAIHYYDEDDIKVDGKIDCDVIVNHEVKLTEEEIEKQKQIARNKIYQEEREKMTSKNRQKKKSNDNQQTLF